MIDKPEWLTMCKLLVKYKCMYMAQFKLTSNIACFLYQHIASLLRQQITYYQRKGVILAYTLIMAIEKAGQTGRIRNMVS